MPLGILLNRLSRPKEGETPEDQLQKGRVLLLEEMLPAIHPDAQEGRDYLYKEDIVSRMKAHQEGALVDWALGRMRRGEVEWIAVTEIARITGDLGAFAEILELCELHRIRIYTRPRVRHPFEPWRAESARDLWIEFFLTRMEIVSYQGRVERKRATSYPISAETGEKRLTTFEGIGRHLNGAIPMGYRWDKGEKRVLPADRVPDDLASPGHPSGATWWDVARRVRELGRTVGVRETVRRVFAETGLQLNAARINDTWHNPFYAGRPTLTTEVRGGRLVQREEPLSTTGNYPAIDTWEDHLTLQAAVAARNRTGWKPASPNWVSGLLLCECGFRFTGKDPFYVCSGLTRDRQMRVDRNLQAETGMSRPLTGILGPEWERTPTCGAIPKEQVHAHIERHLLRFFERSNLPEMIARWARRAERAQPDREKLQAQEREVIQATERNKDAQKRARDYATRGIFTEAEFREQRQSLEAERVALDGRLARIREELAAPVATPASVAALETVIRIGFPAVWEAALPNEKAFIARAVVEHVPVRKRTGRYGRTLGAPVWRIN